MERIGKKSRNVFKQGIVCRFVRMYKTFSIGFLKLNSKKINRKLIIRNFGNFYQK